MKVIGLIREILVWTLKCWKGFLVWVMIGLIMGGLNGCSFWLYDLTGVYDDPEPLAGDGGASLLREAFINSFVVSCYDSSSAGTHNGKLFLRFSEDDFETDSGLLDQSVYDANGPTNTNGLEVIVFDYDTYSWYVIGGNGWVYTYSDVVLSGLSSTDSETERVGQSAIAGVKQVTIYSSNVLDEPEPAHEDLDILAGVYFDRYIMVGTEGGLLYYLDIDADEWYSFNTNTNNPFLGKYDISGFAHDYHRGTVLVVSRLRSDNRLAKSMVGLLWADSVDEETKRWIRTDMPLVDGHSIYDAAYGKDRYVIVGGEVLGNGDDTPSIAVGRGLHDEGEWTKVEHEALNERFTLFSVVYGSEEGLFVAVGSRSKVLYSSDGLKWTGVSRSALPVTSDEKSIRDYQDGEAFIFSDVTYVNGVFIAVGGHRGLPSHSRPSNSEGHLIGRILYSKDGVTWHYAVNSPLSQTSGVGLRQVEGRYAPSGASR